MGLSFKDLPPGTISDNIDFHPLPVTMCYSAAIILLIGAVICLFIKPEPLREGDTNNRLPLALALSLAIIPVRIYLGDLLTGLAFIAMLAGFILLARYLARCGASLSKRYSNVPAPLMIPLPALGAAAILAALPHVHFALTH